MGISFDTFPMLFRSITWTSRPKRFTIGTCVTMTAH